jgi:hypothetical protein
LSRGRFVGGASRRKPTFAANLHRPHHPANPSPEPNPAPSGRPQLLRASTSISIGEKGTSWLSHAVFGASAVFLRSQFRRPYHGLRAPSIDGCSDAVARSSTNYKRRFRRAHGTCERRAIRVGMAAPLPIPGAEPARVRSSALAWIWLIVSAGFHPHPPGGHRGDPPHPPASPEEDQDRTSDG